MGILSIRACKKINNVHKKGIGLVISGVACIVFSLTPVADVFSLVPVVMRDTVASLEPDQYIEITDEEYNIYAFLGTSSSKPEDHDILEYEFDDFDGSTKEVYSKYKVCGYLSNETDYKWYNVKLEVVLIDDDGNDILIDGNPVTLTAEFPYSIRDGGIEKFETNMVSAKHLSAQPTKFRIKSVVIAT